MDNLNKSKLNVSNYVMNDLKYMAKLAEVYGFGEDFISKTMSHNFNGNIYIYPKCTKCNMDIEYIRTILSDSIIRLNNINNRMYSCNEYLIKMLLE